MNLERPDAGEQQISINLVLAVPVRSDHAGVALLFRHPASQVA